MKNSCSVYDMNHNEIKSCPQRTHKGDPVLKLSVSQRLRPGAGRVVMTKIIEYFIIIAIIEL